MAVQLSDERGVMGAKDITEKTLEAYNDVFADIVNVLLFQGRLVVDERELEDVMPRSHYKVDEKLHEMERDVAKLWKHHRIRIAFLGIENQTKPDEYMPVRVIGYDGMAYRAQLLDVEENGKHRDIYPVVTLVLYFGARHWNKSLTLMETLEIPEELKAFVNDYKINMFEIAYLTEEQVNMFQSDFRYVADYFVQSRKNRHYIPTAGTIKHVHETLELLEVMTGDIRFEEACNSLKGDERTMSEAILDRMEELFRERGMKEGLQEGMQKGMQKGLQEGRQKGLQEGRKEGRKEGQQQGEHRALALAKILLDAGRLDDLNRATADIVYRNQLIHELMPDEE